ncbi:MAG: hypothetical protein K940chlam5_01312 [Candidatus Anoxychlamydiales bacterium]|nr:hypothetical protein [Candidatus Anoxychlamydiales bacterium]
MSINPPSLLENMPEEIILRIFKQGLDITDLKAVRALGRKWYRIANDEELWENIAARINYFQKPIEGMSMANLVRSYVKNFINLARVQGIVCAEFSFIADGVRNIRNDADLTIDKINALKKILEKEKRWHRISPQTRTVIDYCDYIEPEPFKRSATPTRFLEKHFLNL